MYMVANSAHSVPSKLWEAMHSVSEACKLWEPGMQVLGARHSVSEACKLWEPGMQVLGARHSVSEACKLWEPGMQVLFDKIHPAAG